MTDKLALPDALVVRQYRGYRDEQRLDLRPLTLLYGRNNAGKSALLRALPLLADSIRSRGGQALDMAGPVVRAGRFDDLVWRGGSPPDAPIDKMTLGMRWPGGAALDVAFKWPDRRTVSLAALRSGGDGGAWWREQVSRTPPPSGVVAFEGLVHPAEVMQLRREGLSLSAERDGRLPAEVGEALERWNAFGDQVQWLTASRRLGERVFEYARLTGEARLASDGRDVTGWLVEHPEHCARISAQWYERHLGARLQVVERPPVGYSVRLEPVEMPGLGVDLVDTGEGNVQVLSVLAALSMAEAGDGPPIIVLEEPESHLHPHLQAELAARVREVIEGESDVRVVMETHSEHLLLAIQKLVLEGFDPAQVALYWVERHADGQTRAERVEVRRDGTFDDKWPPGVFGETLALSREIMRLQLERAGELSP